RRLRRQLRANARSSARLCGNRRSKNNALVLDEVLEKCNLENFARQESRCAALAKNVFRSFTAKYRVVLRKMEVRLRESSAGGIGEHAERVAVYGRDFPIGIPFGLVVHRRSQTAATAGA